MKMCKCEHLIDDYLFDRLDDEKKKKFEEHYFNCPYCFESKSEKDKISMNDKMCERLISAIKKKCKIDGTKSLSIMLFGGEPMLEMKYCRKILHNLGEWAHNNNIVFTGFATFLPINNCTIFTFTKKIY